MTSRTRLVVVVLGVLGLLAPAAAGSSPPLDLTAALTGDAPGVSESGVYVVVMSGDPPVRGRAHGPAGGRADAATAAFAAEARERHRAVLDAVGSAVRPIHHYTHALDGFAARLTHDQATRLAARPEVALVVADALHRPLTDASPAFLGVSGPAGAWQAGHTGEGVTIGVIDTGIWPEHPSFADDGSYDARPAGLPCEFGAVDHRPDDVPFACNGKLIGAREVLDAYRQRFGIDEDDFASARDAQGHGTHTAAIAAGDADVAATVGVESVRVSGIAPRARVVAYKALGRLGGFTSDVTAAIDLAVADGVDVINYSLGGRASLVEPDDLALLAAVRAGVAVAVAAGNGGPNRRSVLGPASTPWVTAVGASTQARTFVASAVLGNGRRIHGVSVGTGTRGPVPLVDGAAAGDVDCRPGMLDPGSVAGAVVACRRGVVARAAKSAAVQAAGGVGMILYEPEGSTGEQFADPHPVPTVHVGPVGGARVAAHVASSDAPTVHLLAARRRAVPSAPTLAGFSGRGENVVARDVLKPDVLAPGHLVLAAAPPGDTTAGGAPVAVRSGTSMAAPHVAGLYALLRQAHPRWGPGTLRSALATTADADVRTVTPTIVGTPSPFDRGAGQVDVTPAGPSGPLGRRPDPTAFAPGLVYPVGYEDYLAFLCGAAPEVFDDPDATCTAMVARGRSTDPSDLNLPSIAVGELFGSQRVVRTVRSIGSGRRTWTVAVEPPAGYVVAVDPPRLDLRPGQSASFTVTITRTDGAIGRWRFGALTWRSGTAAVRSPIAVYGVLSTAGP